MTALCVAYLALHGVALLVDALWDYDPPQAWPNVADRDRGEE